MERTLTQDERIRRAEEIYAKRQNLRERTKRATLNVSETPKNLKLFKRIILQIVICVLIYFIFYLVNTTNYSFSEVAIDKIKEILSQDIDFVSIYNNTTNWLENYMMTLTQTEGNTENVENNVIEEQGEMQNNVNVIEQGQIENSIEENKIENIAVSEDTNETTGQPEIQNTELSETDRIKTQYSFIQPITRNSNIRIWGKRGYIKYNIYIPQRNRYSSSNRN